MIYIPRLATWIDETDPDFAAGLAALLAEWNITNFGPNDYYRVQAYGSTTPIVVGGGGSTVTIPAVEDTPPYNPFPDGLPPSSDEDRTPADHVLGTGGYMTPVAEDSTSLVIVAVIAALFLLD